MNYALTQTIEWSIGIIFGFIILALATKGLFKDPVDE